MNRLCCLKFCVVWISFACFTQMAASQSVLFNVPTTDTVAPKTGFFEFEYMPQFPAPGTGRIHVFTARFVAGLASNLEAGANVSELWDGLNPSSTFLVFQPNLKYKFASDGAKGLAAAAGAIWYEALSRRDVLDNFGLVYANFSKQFQTNGNGPKIIFGPYAVVGADDGRWYGTKAGAIIGYEQAVHPKLSILADWFSGVSLFGYFTPGIAITLPRKSALSFAYSIGNDSYSGRFSNNRFLLVEYSIAFP